MRADHAQGDATTPKRSLLQRMKRARLSLVSGFIPIESRSGS